MNKLIKLSRNFIILGITLMIVAVIMNHGKIPLFANHYEEKPYVKSNRYNFRIKKFKKYQNYLLL